MRRGNASSAARATVLHLLLTVFYKSSPSCFMPTTTDPVASISCTFKGGRAPFLSLFTRSDLLRSSNLIPSYPLSFQISAHFFAPFCLRKKLNSFVSKHFHVLHPRSRRRGAKLPNIQTCRSPPSVPLQPAPFGATICLGTRILRDSGKQLRSRRCLSIVSGHREPFEDVPGYTPTRSGLQVDRLAIALATRPGSTILTVDSSRVARATHPSRTDS
jgi:hypothetical protein